jgi:anti-sigma factor RsiW
MMDCDGLLDLMPERAAGRIDWPEGAEAHLANCEECRRSWALIRAAARVGTAAADRTDSERIGRSVLARLAEARAQNRRRKGWTWGTLLAAAAAVLLVVYPGRHPNRVAAPVAVVSATTSFSVPLLELQDLDATELQAVDDQLDGALSASGSVGAPHLEELTPDEMQRVLNSMGS